jgi:hypothetical protein
MQSARKVRNGLDVVDEQTHFGDHERFNSASVWDMRPKAKIDHGTTAIDSGRGSIGNLGFEKMDFVLVVLL